jgi:hypothetical protein
MGFGGAARHELMRTSLRRFIIYGSCPCPDLGPMHMAPT